MVIIGRAFVVSIIIFENSYEAEPCLVGTDSRALRAETAAVTRSESYCMLYMLYVLYTCSHTGIIHTRGSFR